MTKRRRGNGQGSVYKRGGRGVWIAAWYDHAGKRCVRSTQTTDRVAAERILTKYVTGVALRREGVIDVEQDELAKAARLPLKDHLSDFRTDLERKRSADHVALTITRIERLCKEASACRWIDLTPTAIERALASIQRDDKLCDTTRNRYRTAIVTFGNWMVRNRRANDNPAADVERADSQGSEYRRALTPEEATLLIVAANAGEPMAGRRRDGSIRWCLAGHERALLYRFAWETGLRRSTIAKLIVADLDLGDEPSIHCKGQRNTKEKRDRIVPLRDDTARKFKQHVAAKAPAAPLFTMPAKWETADVLRRDLAEARRAWIDKGATAEERAKRAASDFLADKDSEGRRIDFHALRTTCGTWLDGAGVAASVAKQITGHASVDVLRKHYHRAAHAEARRAIDRLPDIDVPPTLAATGTDDHGAQQYAQQREREPAQRNANRRGETDATGNGRDERKSLRVANKRDVMRPGAKTCQSESDGNRTRNLRIDSPVL